MPTTEKSKTKGLKIAASIDLDKLILATISDLCDSKISEDAKKFDEELAQVQTQIKVVESKYRCLFAAVMHFTSINL